MNETTTSIHKSATSGAQLSATYFFTLLLILIIVGGVFYLIIYKIINPLSVLPTPIPTPNPASFQYPFDIKSFNQGYLVGNVLIYTSDLEYRFNLMFEDTQSNRSDLNNWLKVADALSNDVILQNEGINLDLFEKPVDRKINPLLVNQAREYFTKQGTSFISGERISLWFHNTPLPTMGIEAARALALKTIQTIYNKLQSDHTYTLKEAGQEIISNLDFERMDGAYKWNTYGTFENVKPDIPFFTDPEINTALWNLNKNELSPILTARDYDGSNWYDAYFTIIKVTDKNENKYKSLDEFITAKKAEGLIIKL